MPPLLFLARIYVFYGFVISAVSVYCRSYASLCGTPRARYPRASCQHLQTYSLLLLVVFVQPPFSAIQPSQSSQDSSTPLALVANIVPTWERRLLPRSSTDAPMGGPSSEKADWERPYTHLFKHFAHRHALMASPIRSVFRKLPRGVLPCGDFGMLATSGVSCRSSPCLPPVLLL